MESAAQISPEFDAIAANPSHSASGPKNPTWRAGTLLYTAGGLGWLFFWLLWGDLSLSLKERSVPPTLQLLLQRFSASNATTGLLLGTLPAVITIILSPIVSYRSDRHRGRWGRRIPFLFLPTPLAVIAMVGLAFSPSIGRLFHAALGPATGASENVCVLISFAFFWVIFEVCSIVCLAVFTGLCNDVVPPGLLGRFFGLFRMVSVGAAIVFNFWLFGLAERYFREIFLSLAALYGVSFSLMCLRVREGEYPPPPPPPPPPPSSPPNAPTGQRALRLVASIRTYCRECFGVAAYRWLFLSIALANMSFTCVTLFTVYFAKATGMDMGRYGKYLTVQFIISFAQSFALGWLCDRFHPLRVKIVSLALYTAATLAAFLLIRDAHSFGVLSVIVGVFAGWWLTAYGPLLPALVPRAQFAQFASAALICSCLGTLIVGPACGTFLDWLGNDYRYIYLWAATLATFSLLATIPVYRTFIGPDQQN